VKYYELHFLETKKSMTEALDPTQIFCIEDLVASLRHEEILTSELLRQIYITSKPMGSPGSTGKMQRGDLGQDLNAKLVYFDKVENKFTVVRNGNPPREPELVPDGDIGAVVRSFVRDNLSTEPVYLTVADSDIKRGIETIRYVIPARQLELYCEHGPDPSARGVSGYRCFTGGGSSKVSMGAVLGILFLVVAICFIYFRYFRAKVPPRTLPDMRPYVVAQRKGVRNLMQDDVKGALEKVRASHQ
jgi:hypothetical protein